MMNHPSKAVLLRDRSQIGEAPLSSVTVHNSSKNLCGFDVFGENASLLANAPMRFSESA